jgi:hypothetical protein
MRAVVEAVADEHTSRTEIAGTVEFATGRGSVVVTTDGKEVTVLGDGATTYVSVPEADRALTDGKPWLSFPAPDTSDGLLDLGDPARLLDLLHESEGVESLGDEDVNGVATRHYSANLADLSVEGAQLDAGRADVWITRDGLPTRVVVEYVFGLGEIAVTVDLTDFGVEVDDVAPPDPADVFAGTEQLANRWLQPNIAEVLEGGALDRLDPAAFAGFADGLGCAALPLLAEALDRQAGAMTDDQLAEMERALAAIDAQADSVDDSTADGARQRAALLASASAIRAVVTAARTGDAVDPEALRPMLEQLGQSCAG